MTLVYVMFDNSLELHYHTIEATGEKIFYQGQLQLGDLSIAWSQIC